jgi:hypothetical protein
VAAILLGVIFTGIMVSVAVYATTNALSPVTVVPTVPS